MIVLSHALHDDGTTKIGLFCEFLNVLMWKIIIYLSNNIAKKRRVSTNMNNILLKMKRIQAFRRNNTHIVSTDWNHSIPIRETNSFIRE